MNFYCNLVRRCLLTAFSIGYLILWMGGIGSHLLWGRAPSDMPWTAPAFLLLSGAIVVTTSSVSEITFLLVGSIVGFIAEVSGVHSGVIFGGYWYTDVLQPKLFGVPLVMVCAWLVLIGYVRQMLLGCAHPRWLIVLLAGAWMTAIDLVLDPLAAGVLGYWRWVENGIYYGIPVHNFVGWFAVTVVVFSSLPGPVVENAWAEYTGLSIVLFFTVLAWIHGLVLPGVIGAVLCTLHIMVTGGQGIRRVFSGIFPFRSS